MPVGLTDSLPPPTWFNLLMVFQDEDTRHNVKDSKEKTGKSDRIDSTGRENRYFIMDILTLGAKDAPYFNGTKLMQ